MTDSDTQQQILKHLGYPEAQVPDPQVLDFMARAWEDLEKLSDFKYLYAEYSTLPDFLMQSEAYREYLAGSDGLLLCATTLGSRIDQHIQRMQLREMAYAVVLNAAAGVYLEQKADDFEKALPYSELGYRFCPGYSGTPLEDNRTIAWLLHAHRIGITFLDSGLMVPSKSMTGIIRIGGKARKCCAGCVNLQHCPYRERGTKCYPETL